MKCTIAGGATLSADVKTALTARERVKGLLDRTGLNPGESLVIKPCAQIHTFFMKFPIAVVFFDKNNRVLRVFDNIPPWRISPWVFGAAGVVELSAGASGGIVKPGDMLEFTV